MKIDKNIPIPVRTTINKRYPIDKMEHGDSFIIEGVTKTQAYSDYHNMNKYMMVNNKPYKF